LTAQVLLWDISERHCELESHEALTMKKITSNQRLADFSQKTLAIVGCCIAFGAILSPTVRAQNAESGKATASTPAVATSTATPAVSVSTVPSTPTGPSIADAVLLYRAGDYEKSSSEYNEVIASNPNSAVAYAGLARVYVKQAKLAEALTAANKSVALAPANPLSHIALGEVYFRSGKISEAEAEFVPIIKSGQAYARAYLGEARVSRASSFYKQAKRMIDFAHTLDPLDPDIASFWLREQSLADRIKAIKDELANPANSDPKKKAELEESLAFLNDAESRHESCELVSKVSSIEVPFVMLLNDPNTYRAVGLKVDVNGTSANLMLDTGSTGILIGRRVAEKAGITKVASTSISGIGDRGDQSGYVGHADSIRVGGLEFRNCYVEVSDKKTTVDDDGLLGADLFHHFLVDLDFSARKFRLSELPARPDDNPPSSSPDSKAASQLHDRYIAPEMKSYTPVYRFGHSLLIPTRLNDQVTSLFLIDSGSTFNMMSPAAAREVTKVGSDSMTTIKGLNGNVKNVYRADRATLTFGHLKQQNQDITAFDTSSISNSVGTEVSGILGFSTLGLLDVKIDYRDGLVDFTFDSQKWCQGKCR
jgi:hypothetical protein